ncbi:MAG: NAD(P)-dependent oxidoreductase [Proteobacteria bacterium]|nr:MAG: NAD(P)-dependent oxidoreductase [Pseudomonadota bacterium]
MSIIVTGASGSFGRMVTELLLQRVEPANLILVTRTPDKLASLAERGVQVRYGDFDDAESLRSAFAGGQRMLLISTLDVGERRRRQHKTAIEAAVAARVEHIAYTSSTGIHPRSPAFVIEDHLATEERLRQSGVAYTFLRDAQYAEVIATMMAPMAIATGQWVSSVDRGCIAFVSKQDCVAAAAAVLTTPGHEGAAYEITGPELLTFRDAAAIAAEVSGRSVEFVLVTHDEMQARFDAAGVPRRYVEGMQLDHIGPWGSEEMMSYERAVDAGYFSICSHHVELLTGRPAKSLREVFIENRDALMPKV